MLFHPLSAYLDESFNQSDETELILRSAVRHMDDPLNDTIGIGGLFLQHEVDHEGDSLLFLLHLHDKCEDDDLWKILENALSSIEKFAKNSSDDQAHIDTNSNSEKGKL